MIKPTKASREVHRLAREMTKYWPEMQDEFMCALSDWELDMNKACEEAFSMGVEHGMKLAKKEEE
jgi:hypothetical protein